MVPLAVRADAVVSEARDGVPSGVSPQDVFGGYDASSYGRKGKLAGLRDFLHV